MTVYTQEPADQQPIQISLPAPAAALLGGAAGLVDPSTWARGWVLGDGLAAAPQPLLIPSLILGLLQITSSNVDSVRDAFLGNTNCPKIETYPPTGWRGPGWYPANIT